MPPLRPSAVSGCVPLFFEAKSPGKKLWVSFNGVIGRVLFFKICCNKNDPTLLDGFPLYWTWKPGLKKPISLEDLPAQEQKVCDFLSNLQVVFSSVELIKHEYNPTSLKGYIGNPFPPTPTSVCLACVLRV